MKILFSREFLEGFTWKNLAARLPGHEIHTCTFSTLEEHLAGIDILVPFGAPIERSLIERGQFRLIQQFGVGLEKINIEAATEAGVWVARLPAAGTGNADSVAEHALSLMLALSRRLLQADQMLRQGRWWGLPPGEALLGKTACLVGVGDIGLALARRLRVMGMNLIGVRKNVAAAIVDNPFWRIYSSEELHTALAQSDYVIICVKYDVHNHHLINQVSLAAMKKGAYLINIARGGLVDPDALLDALQSGHLAGAGLDVFWEEPVDPTHAIFQQNVIATPHIAGFTDAFYQGGSRVFCQNIELYSSGKQIYHSVNRPSRPRHPLV